MNAHVAKPVEEKALLEALFRFLGGEDEKTKTPEDFTSY
jgi:hypothetical protein